MASLLVPIADDAQMVSRQVKEVEAETSTIAEGVMMARGTMGRVLAAWESYRDCLFSMQVWLGQQTEATDATVKEVGTHVLPHHTQ